MEIDMKRPEYNCSIEEVKRWEKAQAAHGKYLSDEHTRVMPAINKKITDLRLQILKQQGTL